MVTYTLIKLKEMSPLHMGTGKENYDFSASYLHSDTLSAALTAMKVRLHGEQGVKEFIESFVISSAFPYVGGHFFLPRPYGKLAIHIYDCDKYVSRKKLKSIKFIELDLWKDLVAGGEIVVSVSQLKNGFLVKDIKDFKQPCQSAVHQRVFVPRGDNMPTEPFFFDWTFFNDDAGLYCLTDAEGENLKEMLGLFEILGETGIGTDKNVGGGKFTVEAKKIDIPEVKSAQSQLLLSLYIPTEEELSQIDLSNSRYELFQRGGYMAGSQEYAFGHLRKKSVYMLGVGSVLKSVVALKGKVVDLRPTDYNDCRMHPVYRSGRPFVVPVNL